MAKSPVIEEEKKETKRSFDETSLTKKKQEYFAFVKKRIEELQQTREDHYGVNLDKLWSEADAAYIPHRLKSKGKKVVATDEERGWRGALVDLQKSGDWQSDISESNPYIKIGTALAILVDQNPSGTLTPSGKKFEKTTNLIEQLYNQSWETAKSKGQLKLFVHNLAKYGFAAARTYPLRIERTVQKLVTYNEESPEDSVYEEKKVLEYNDVFRENLDPRNVWIDDMAKPNNPFSVRDWAWRKVYSMDAAEEEFGKYKNWKFVQSGGNTQDVVGDAVKGKSKNLKDGRLLEVYFYESRLKDLFMVIANGVPIVIEPLPVADINGVKKLSLWHAYWTLRHAESVYGIGIYEAIRYEQGMLDRIRNMTVDQLTLAIYKMFFYQGTQSLSDTGDITITPGKGKQVLDPKNITWLEVPGPGAEAWEGIEMFRKTLDEVSGITDPLLGEVTGKTAFELAQAKESALKRMKTPLDNILDALDIEGYITICLMQLLYSIPETYTISDPKLIEAYLQEIQSDPDLYERGDDDTFTAKVYREFPLNLDKDEKGNLTQTEETQFFRVKPSYLNWAGVINVKSQSILTPSKQIDKTLELEMWNMLIPLLAQPPELYLKAAKSIVKLYDKDPDDILPDSWLNPQPPVQDESLFVDAASLGAGGQPQPVQQGAERFTASPQPASSQTGIANKIMGQVT